MSASSKKKLRREQEAAKLTEKQLTEQKEAKKLKAYTAAFVVVLAALLVIAVWVGVNQTITNTGIREKNTVAVTVGDHEISNAELSYFYIDYINNYYSSYGTYLSWMGLDTTIPLNEQVTNEETGSTWADDFIDMAKSNAISVYALADAAEAAGFQLPEDEKLEIEYYIQNIGAYATLYGYADADAYLKAMYGNGASAESYQEYSMRAALADAYYAHYTETLTYGEEDYTAALAENGSAYSSYDYNYYYLSTSKFLTGGTTAEDGTVTYSDEEKAAAAAAAEEAANALVSAEIASIEDFDAAIAALEINAGTGSSTACNNYGYSSISSLYVDWISDSARKSGDMTMVASTSTTDEVETVNGYYVLYYTGSDDNTFYMPSVRHILVGFEHDHEEDVEHEEGSYTAEEIAAAKAEAEALLAQWEADGATEERFIEMANTQSDDGDGTTGGLYENIYPGQMVANFEAWCYDASRQSGDTGIVETEYGFHVMYFVGMSELTYRDYQIDNELRSNDLSAWYNGLIEAMAVTDGDTKYIRKDITLGA